MCTAPVSSNDVITVTWSYIHTGGLPLTNVSLAYTFTEDSNFWLDKGKVVITRSKDETEPEYEVPDLPQQIPR